MLPCSLSIAGRAGRWASSPTSVLHNSSPSQAKSWPFSVCIHFRLLLPFMCRGRGCDFMHKASEYRGTQGSHPGGLESPPCASLSSQEGCEGHPDLERDTTLRRKGQIGEEVNLARHSLYVKHFPYWNPIHREAHTCVHPDWKPSPNPHSFQPHRLKLCESD